MGLHLSERGARLSDLEAEREHLYTDSELGVEPLPQGFRWDILAVFAGSAAVVIAFALWAVLA
jgi:hypothetical protein